MTSRTARTACAGLTALAALLVHAPQAGAATGPVGTNPADWTPKMTAPDGRNGNVALVRQLVPCGGTMYGVGRFSAFTSPAQGGQVFRRNNVISFSGTTGKVTTFNPNADAEVDTIAFNPSDCTTAYLGGKFTSIGGKPASHIAAVDTRTGALKTGFRHAADREVSSIVWSHGRLLVGGYFTTINGASRSRMASLGPRTGVPDGYLTVSLAGSYPGVSNPTRAWNIQVNHRGTQALVTGVFTSANGKPRQQVLQLDLGAGSATVNGWTSPELTTHCQDGTPFYAQDATYSPDDSKIYIAATGGDVRGGLTHTGVCDAASAYRNAPSSQTHLWVNYTGCDTLLSVVSDASTVYVGGHQRWLDNPAGCNRPGPGAVSRPGLGGIDPATGKATSWRPGRSRGIGADDLVLAFGGLWVASDNQNAVGSCGQEDHPGICFLPY